jgi:hypothetical protein
MFLSIKFKQKNKISTKKLPILSAGILSAIDNFIKYDIIYNNDVTAKDIKDIHIVYDKNEPRSQTSERIASIVSQVCRIVKNF